MKKLLWLLINVCIIAQGFAQTPKKQNVATKPSSSNAATKSESDQIFIENADFSDVDQAELPDGILLRGNVIAKHDGAVLYCNTAYFFKNENYIKCFGDVRIVQGDTITMTSKYAEYNGATKLAFAQNEVVLTTPDSKLETNLLHFDRLTQESYYRTGGVITNQTSRLESVSGVYYVNNKMFNFTNQVVVDNGSAIIKTNYLDYFEVNGHAYAKGPTEIVDGETFIYTENGFYDTKLDVSNMDLNSYIIQKGRRIDGDFLTYDKFKDISTATRNVKMTDTINNFVVTGHYGKYYESKDSMMITKSAVAKSMLEQDTLYIHAQRIIAHGKPEARKVTAFYKVRFYKTDMSGKCDSLHGSEITNITELIGNPVIWNYENEMTGDLMHLISNPDTEKLDSIKVFNNTFLVSKDTLGDGYNQIKGVNLYGRLEDNALKEVDIIKNTEVIYYMRDDTDNELIGINKSRCSKINIIFDENDIEDITMFYDVEGEIFPDDKLHPNDRKLRGFVWRQDERIFSLDDLLPPEEKAYDEKMKALGKSQAIIGDEVNEVLPQLPERPIMPVLIDDGKKAKTKTEDKANELNKTESDKEGTQLSRNTNLLQEIKPTDDELEPTDATKEDNTKQ